MCHWDEQGDWEEVIALPVWSNIGLFGALHNAPSIKAAMRLTQG
ncbi:hypothetical protein R2A130_2704 [Ahrensia sp. R2A130]|nr:hypothetical protein R2A130_2704 [Ahrensia sp. R2A130]